MTGSREYGKIHLLPEDVISRIAAGEVVERPAAVVKELLENSLDAGSSHITVDVEGGGMTRIRVQDNGEGMSRADATLAFHRHATSKVTSDRDLFSVRSMGFRGEALPSIASVSKVSLVTYNGGEEVGTKLTLSGGELEGQEEAVCPQGTMVEIQDLFFNTPARKKFLKTAITEFSHISQVVQQASLAWPNIHFHLRHNGHEVFQVTPVTNQKDRIIQVYQRRLLDHSIDIQGAGPGFTFAGVIVNPLQAKTGRSPQDVFLNHRPIKNGTISHAVYEGYDSFLPKGRHPRFVLFIDMDPSQVDVNVHPAKREVRFMHPEPIHREVRRAIKQALGQPPTNQTIPPSLEMSASNPLVAYKEDTKEKDFPVARESGREAWPGSPTTLPLSSFPSSEPNRSLEKWLDGTGAGLPLETDQQATVIPLGQLSRTFMVVQVGTELQIVDQHTAHERVLFERLCREWSDKQGMSQPLLIPDPIELPSHSAALLKQYVPDLEKLGLVIEPFGQSSFLIREVPALLASFEYSSFVQDLLEDLEAWNSLTTWDQKVRPVLATLACHSAVRAGRRMDPPEMKQLVTEWVEEGMPMTCPHGRRTALRLPAQDLAKIFGRSS